MPEFLRVICENFGDFYRILRNIYDKKLILDSFRDEWLECSVRNSRDADCECAGIFLGMLRKNNNSFVSKRLRTAHRLFMGENLWRKSNLFGKFSVNFSVCNFRDKKPFVKFDVTGKFANENFLGELSGISENVSRGKIWFWLRGLWGSCGNVYFPRTGYLLTLSIPNLLTRNFAADILERTRLSWFERRNEYNLRNQEDIVTFLNNIGLSGAALKVEDIAIIKSIRNNVNRAKNYETANIKRSVAASLEQTQLARKIVEANLLDTLPEKLRELVILRLENPELSLSELGKNLSPQIKKSAVKYRWLSLVKFIENKNIKTTEEVKK